MRISVCTTCSNRLYQLSDTIEHNHKIILNNSDSEWIIVNYGSKDELHQFMMNKLPVMSNRVVYAKETSGRSWHASCAKNSAHILGTGDVLFNLDCDNFIGSSLDIIKNKFDSGIEILHMWTGVPKDGTFGRIALTKNLFHRLNGYDEKLYAMGGQDSDLLRRAIAMGSKHEKYLSSEFKAIKNTKDESIRYIDSHGMTWDQLAEANIKTTKKNIRSKILVANLPEGIFPPKFEIFRGVVA